MFRYSFLLVFLSLSLFAQTQELNSPIHPIELEPSRFENGEELIVTIRIGKYKFSEILITKSQNGYQTELVALFEVLEFPIKQEGSRFGYQGWFVNDANNFSLIEAENSNAFAQGQ